MGWLALVIATTMGALAKRQIVSAVLDFYLFDSDVQRAKSQARLYSVSSNAHLLSLPASVESLEHPVKNTVASAPARV